MKGKVSLLALIALAAAAETPLLPVPLIRQEKNGCGAASVAMVARYWDPSGAPQHEAIYSALMDDGGKGIELARMKDYLGQIGFRAFTIRGTPADLESHLAKGRPLIVGLRSTRTKRLHFAVLTGMDEEHAWLNDPTKKKPRRAERTKFEKEWAAGERWFLLATPAGAR